MKTTNSQRATLHRLAFVFIGLFTSLISSGFEEIKQDGIPVGERGSYVVRDGVPKSLWFDLDEGHAGLLTGISAGEGANLVYEIRGGGSHVQLSKFYPSETWGSESFLEGNQFRGCGHPPYCDGLSPLENKAFREQVDAHAWTAIGKAYVNPVTEISSVWLYNDSKLEGVTYLTNGVPDIPDRFRCDGLVEWAYESAQSILTASYVGTHRVDSEWGIYKAVSGMNSGSLFHSTPKDLYSPPNNDSHSQTSATSAELPDMSQSELVNTPVINGKTYSVSWSAPFDISQVFKYAYGWIAAGVSLNVVDPNTLATTTGTSVTNAGMPQGIYAAGRYRFVIMAMDKMGHWSDPSKTYESPEINWNPTSAPPTIVSQPSNQTGNIGSSVIFRVSASGLAPLTYQWMENGLNIGSATNSTLTISNLTLADAGRSFSVRVTNPQGSIISSSAVLSVNSSSEPDEPNDSSTSATLLELSGTKTGYIGSSSDVDWFKIPVTQSGDLVISLTLPAGMDYELELFGPNNLWIAGSYNLSGQNERIEIPATQTGNYYARVYSYPIGSGSFDVNRSYQITANLRVGASSTIATSVTWSGVVNLTGDVTIKSGGSLVIAPGTLVRCAGTDNQTAGIDTNRIEFILNGGTLDVQGTPASPVTFTSSAATKTPGDWYGIRIKSGDVSMQNCVVEFASEGIRFESTDTRFNNYLLAGVTVQRCTGNGIWTTSGQYAQPLLMDDFHLIGNATGLRAEGPVTMTGGEIKNNASHGVSANTTLVMTGTTVRINGASGIYNDGNTTLTDCVVTYNQGDGITANRKSIIDGCTASYNGGWGISAFGYGTTAELSNNIAQFNGNGIALSGSLTVGVIGNTISNNLGIGLQLNLIPNYGPAGIGATGITGNSIRNNGGVGVQIHGNQPPVLTLSGNDIHQNTGFELRNDSSCTVVANGNYWGEPTNTELTQGVANLSRIHDLRDGASRQVQLADWYAVPIAGVTPGPLQTYTYPVVGVTQTVAGTINNSQIWSGKVLVVGDVTVFGSLTIEPGTQVVFDHLRDTRTGGLDNTRCELTLDGGTLDVQGTEASPVTFTSSGATKVPGDWYGIRIKSGDVSLENCVVEFATEGIRFESTDTRFNTYSLAGVTVQRCTGNGIWTTSGQYAQPLLMDDFHLIGNATGLRAEGPVTMTGGEIKNNASHGVSANTTLVMTGTTVRINGASGIYNDGNTTLTDCVVTYNQGDGITANRKSIIDGCTASHNGGWGISAFGYGTTAELSNNIAQFNGNGIALSGSLTVGVSGNTISNNLGNGLQLNLIPNYGPAGIGATGITGNSIRNNGGVGVQIHGNQPSVLTISGNDIHQNTGFELRNDSGIPIVADNGFWGDPTAKEIDLGQANLTKIYDRNDNASYGQVSIQNQRSSTLLQLPIFDMQPLNQAVAYGETVTLSVHATGSAPITYQWYRNGNAVNNATQPDLTLMSLDSSKAGTYYAVATNGAGYTASEAAVITLIPAPVVPTIVQQPVPQVVPLGASVNFTVAVTGTAPFSYQWRKNGVPIPGAGTATFSIASALLGDAAEYSVFVSNNNGSVASNAAALTVNISGGTTIVRQITKSGNNYTVTITCTPPIGTPAYLVQEIIPTGFTVESISNLGALDVPNSRITWGTFWDGIPRTLIYTMASPDGFSGTVALNGAAFFYGATATTSGQITITITPPLIVAHLEMGLFYDYHTVSIFGEVGRTYTLEVSDDMTEWEDLASITLNSSPRVYVDVESPAKTQRFYRARWIK